MYQISGKDVIFTWLEHETDSERALLFLDWLVEFATDPLKNAQRVPGILAPVYIAIAPLRDKPVVVRFVLADQFHTIVVRGIGPLP